MAIYVKRGDGQWDEAENTSANIKVRDSGGWKDAYLVYVKTPTGWQIVWDNAAVPPVIDSSSTAAYSTDTSSVTINWTQPTIYNFDKYEFTTDGGATWGDASTNANLRSKTWNGLAERTSYTVGVRVVNKSGRTGAATTTLTTANSNPQPPTSGTVTDVTPTSAKLNWTASTSTDKKGGGLTYAVNNSNDTVRVGDTDSTSFTVTGLSQNSSYTYKVYTRDSGDLYSSALSFTVNTTNAAPPAATVTSNGSSETGTSYVQGTQVYKNGSWRVQYSGEAVSVVAYLFDSANNWTGSSVTLYDSSNRQTSVDQYVSFNNLAASTEYRVAVDVTDANDATTRSAYVANTMAAAELYQVTHTVNSFTGSVGPSSGMSASTSVAGFESSKVYSASGWWLSNGNTSGTAGTSYEYIQWDMSWSGDAGLANQYVTGRNYLRGSYDYPSTYQARYISGYTFYAADTDNGVSGNGTTTTGNFRIYYSIYNGTGWRNDGGTIPYTGANGYNIAYTSNRIIGNDGYEDAQFANEYISEPVKLRWTLTNLQLHTGYSNYRGSAYALYVRYTYKTVTETSYYR